ncbi:MAG TPA: 30S ribosomal protein S6 [Candidatus Paceibacterota bacterium]
MEESSSKEGVKVYEISFHILPFVGEENVAHEVSKIKDALDKIKAVVISEDFPRLRVLAYPITKVIKGDKKICNEAYFGWVKFEASTEVVNVLKGEVEELPNVIRYLIMKTVRENTLYGAKFVRDKEIKRERKEEQKTAAKVQINQEELDKTIDSLVVE